MVDRDLMLNVRVSEAERRMIAELSDELGISQSGLVRQWIRREHEGRFGPPPPKKKRKKP